MKQTAAYFLAQLKRMARLLPGQILVDLAVCVCAGALVCLLLAQGAAAAAGTRYRIGMVGDLSASYLGFGIAAVQEMDDSRFMVELIPMEEREAEVAFERGELYAVMRVPERLMESIVYGTNDNLVTYTATQGQQGLGTMVMGEITDVASTLVTCSQSAIYAMQRVLADQGRGEEIGRETDKLNLALIQMALDRGGFGEVEILGYGDGLSLELYYFCGVILLFLLLSGLLNSALFLHGNGAFSCFLKARGVGVFRQILGEYAAYLLLVLAGLFSLCLPLGFGLGRELLAIPEWEGMGAGPFFTFLPLFLPVAAMFAAMQLFLFEAAEGIVNGILLQLICGIGMGYLSGYFYPSAFFPETMRALGELLPSGAAARFAQAGALGKIPAASWAAVFGWLAAFLTLTVLVREWRIGK